LIEIYGQQRDGKKNNCQKDNSTFFSKDFLSKCVDQLRLEIENSEEGFLMQECK
jgi:hypothetical protein